MRNPNERQKNLHVYPTRVRIPNSDILIDAEIRSDHELTPLEISDKKMSVERRLTTTGVQGAIGAVVHAIDPFRAVLDHADETLPPDEAEYAKNVAYTALTHPKKHEVTGFHLGGHSGLEGDKNSYNTMHLRDDGNTLHKLIINDEGAVEIATGTPDIRRTIIEASAEGLDDSGALGVLWNNVRTLVHDKFAPQYAAQTSKENSRRSNGAFRAKSPREIKADWQAQVQRLDDEEQLARTDFSDPESVLNSKLALEIMTGIHNDNNRSRGTSAVRTVADTKRELAHKIKTKKEAEARDRELSQVDQGDLRSVLKSKVAMEERLKYVNHELRMRQEPTMTMSDLKNRLEKEAKKNEDSDDGYGHIWSF